MISLDFFFIFENLTAIYFHLMKKQFFTLHFTVHSLLLPKYKKNPFSIKWYLGHYSGTTDHFFSTNDNNIQFEQTFELTTHFNVKRRNGHVLKQNPEICCE
jgi:hypothetical protein